MLDAKRKAERVTMEAGNVCCSVESRRIRVVKVKLEVGAMHRRDLDDQRQSANDCTNHMH